MFVMPRPLTGANVLLLIREGKANDKESLCREFGLQQYASYYIEPKVQQLLEAGLIVAAENGRFEVTDNWRRIQAALEMSLTQVSMLGTRSLVVQPYFGPPDKLANPIDLFVVMPFRDDLKPVWDDHIKKIALTLGVNAVRADDFFTTHSIMADVWNAIAGARVVITDCTGRNPNVFYELGVAHTVGKPVILIAQNVHDVPSDVRHIRYIQYEYTPRGMQQFEQRLEQTLRTEFGIL
jgi:hypothetical protein